MLVPSPLSSYLDAHPRIIHTTITTLNLLQHAFYTRCFLATQMRAGAAAARDNPQCFLQQLRSIALARVAQNNSCNLDCRSGPHNRIQIKLLKPDCMTPTIEHLFASRLTILYRFTALIICFKAPFASFTYPNQLHMIASLVFFTCEYLPPAPPLQCIPPVPPLQCQAKMFIKFLSSRSLAEPRFMISTNYII